MEFITKTSRTEIENSEEFRRFIGEYEPPISWKLEIKIDGWDQKYALSANTVNKDGLAIAWRCEFGVGILYMDDQMENEQNYNSLLRASLNDAKRAILSNLAKLGYDGKAKQTAD